MASRRNFIKNIGALAATTAVSPLIASNPFNELDGQLAKSLSKDTPNESDDEFWTWVRNNYYHNNEIINLNNGGVSPHAKVVHKFAERLTMQSDEVPSYYMWRVLEKDKEPIRESLAKMAGVSAEEIAINRNTTEGLDTIIFGIDLEKGDEVVHSNFIYPNMNQAWMQREMREGIVRKIAKLPLPTKDNEAIIKAYTDQFTSKTKVVHITHLINWTGQIMPVAEIATAAKNIGAKVIVDGAHSFAHFDFKIPDLNCDYFATSLHKWLGAPFGTGMLWMKKELIADHWALFPGPDPKSNDIKKFENLGTRDVPKEVAIHEAIKFHERIGIERKAARLQYLKEYWVNQVKDLPKVTIQCPVEKEFSRAIATISIEGYSPNEIYRHLWNEENIHTTSIKHEGIFACRISPNVYTSTDDLDKLVRAIKKLV